MRNLRTLVMMQLKDKIDFSFLKSKQKTIFKVVFTILKFAIITGLIYLGFSLVSGMRLVSLLPGIPVEVLTIIITLMMGLSILACTFGLMKSLYFSLDNRVLLTLPTSRLTIFASKLLVYYIYEIFRNVTYILPIFIAYAMINGYPIYFYLWLIPTFLLITAIPVVIGAMLSIPAMYISNFVKRFKWLELLLLAVGVGLVTWLLVTVIGIIPTNIDLIGQWGTIFWQIQDFISAFVKAALPFYWIVTSVVGVKYGIRIDVVTTQSLLYFLGLVGFVLVMIGLILLIVRPLFFHMISIPFEFRKNNEIKEKKNHKLPAFWSAIRKEVVLSYRQQSKFYSLLYVVVGTPIVILLLNKIYAAMDTRISGTYMTIAFNVLLLLLIVCSSNSSMASVYSEEGASSYLIKTTPKPFLQSLVAKIIVNAVGVSISIGVSVGIFVWFSNISVVNGIIIFVMVDAFYLGHLLFSACLDIMNPQTAQYATTGEVSNNPNEIKSVIVALALSSVIALATFFLISENPLSVWTKLMCVGLVFLAWEIYNYVSKINVYYKEK